MAAGIIWDNCFSPPEHRVTTKTLRKKHSIMPRQWVHFPAVTAKARSQKKLGFGFRCRLKTCLSNPPQGNICSMWGEYTHMNAEIQGARGWDSKGGMENNIWWYFRGGRVCASELRMSFPEETVPKQALICCETGSIERRGEETSCKSKSEDVLRHGK